MNATNTHETLDRDLQLLADNRQRRVDTPVMAVLPRPAKSLPRP